MAGQVADHALCTTLGKALIVGIRTHTVGMPDYPHTDQTGTGQAIGYLLQNSLCIPRQLGRIELE